MAQRTAGNRPGVMERIAVGSVALSVAVMIVAVAVVVGFKEQIAHKITAFAAHVTITEIREAAPVQRSAHLENLIRSTDGFVSMTPYALKGGIVRTDEAVGEVVLKGIDTTCNLADFRGWLTAGELPRIGDSVRTKDILISRKLADKLQLGVGDKVEMLFVEQGDMPHRDRFKVSGIYASGLDEMDNTMILTDLRNVQRLSEWSANEITGYEVMTSDLKSAPDFARRLQSAFFYDGADETANLAVQAVQETYAHIFDWLKAIDVNTVVVIVIMLVVAFFNMTSALLILVLERTRMIGLLKALGMQNRAIRELFLWRVAFITARGLLWGNVIGLALCAAQKYLHLVKLDASNYLLSEVPVALGWGWWLALNVGTLAVIVLLLVLPTHIVTKLKPSEAIRYE